MLFRWKKIIICAVAFALLLGCFQAAVSVFSNSEKDEETTTLTEKQKYENNKVFLERKIDEYESLISNQYKYMHESIMMRLDPHNSFSAEASIYISSDYQIMPEMTYQNKDYTANILRFNVNLLNDTNTLDEIAKQVGTDAEYLKELVSVWSSDSWLEISILHYNKQTAEHVLELLIEYVNQAKAKVTKSIGTHSVEIMSQSVAEYVGYGIIDKQTQEREYMSELELELKTAQEELLALDYPDSILVKCIKKMILGFIAGAAVSVVAICVVFIFSDKVCSDKELERRLGIKVFGKISGNKPANDPISKCIERMAGRIEHNTEENYELIATRINYCAKEDKVAFAVVNLDDSSNEIADEMNKCCADKFVSIGAVLENTKALKALAHHKEVVLVVYAEKSKYNRVIKELSQIKDAGAKCIGCILVE